jgi:hypothetical protein
MQEGKTVRELYESRQKIYTESLMGKLNKIKPGEHKGRVLQHISP